MMCYKDMTFCTFYKDCKKAKECPRPLTPEVIEAAVKWWGGKQAPIAQYSDKPDCWESEFPAGSMDYGKVE